MIWTPIYIYIVILRVCHKHPPIFVILSVGKSFGVTPKSVFTDKTYRQLEKKSVEKSVDFYGQEKLADFLVGGEIVWWDTSFSCPQVGNWQRGSCPPGVFFLRSS